jgi:hypothetical protein
MTIYQDQDWASQTFFYAGLGQVLEQFEQWFSHGVQRMAFFSVSAMLYDLSTNSLPAVESRQEFYDEIYAWSDPFIHNVDYSIDRPDQPYWDTIYRSDESNGDT